MIAQNNRQEIGFYFVALVCTACLCMWLLFPVSEARYQQLGDDLIKINCKLKVPLRNY